jgi:hypothetical protein
MHHKIVYLVIENCLWLPDEFKPRLPLRLSGKLFLDQMGVIKVEMHVPAHPHQFAGLKASLLRQHPGKQRG